MTPVDAARLLVDAGFVGWQVVTIGAIGGAESGLDAHAIGLNDHDPGSRSYLSVDWGWLQINDYWNTAMLIGAGVLRAELPVSMQLLDPEINARAARAVFLDRNGLKDSITAYKGWHVYQTATYELFLPGARAAARTIGVPV